MSQSPRGQEAAGSLALTGTSALAREVRRMSVGQLGAIGVADEAIFLWDSIVTCAAVLIDDSDSAPWQTRLEQLTSAFQNDAKGVDWPKLQNAANYLSRFTADDLPEWARQLKKDGPRRFLVRMLGAASFRRCARALQEDGAILTIALRRAARNLMPYAVALDDLYSVLPPEKAAEVPALTGGKGSVISLAVQLDQLFERKTDEWNLAITLSTTREDELRGLTLDDVAGLMDDFRSLVTGRSRQAVTDLNASLGRKIHGARQALQFSDDGVAQAATSLIELLDRVLRSAFSDDQVLRWVDENYTNLSDLSFERHGKRLPTKRAQALCFAHAGEPVQQRSPIHELAATAIVSARTELQKLKHADLGTPEELASVGKCLAALEGFMTLVAGVIWANAPTERVEQFKARLDARS